MKKIKILPVILLVSIFLSVFSPVSADAVEQPSPGANAVVLMDTVTGNVLFSTNADTKVFPASTTKIMTVLLAVEAVERGDVALSDYVTASDNIAFDMIEDGSSVGIVAGETMTLENLMYCAMVSSANEACNAIAEYISGSIPSFVAKMNERATQLGCTGTNFTNTHGLPDENHYTTAQDFSIISLEAISHPLFMQISNTASITIPATNKSEERRLSNTNGLINKDSVNYPGYYYDAAAGIKTGHTEAAGYCLVSTATKNGMTLLCVVMGGKATEKAGGFEYGSFTDSIMLYNWAFENYSYRDILKITALVEDIPVKMGSDANFVTVHPQTAVKALLPNDEDIDSYEQKITIYSQQEGKELMAPVDAGEVLGEITIERDGVVYGSSLLVANSSVDLSYGKYIKSQIAVTLKKPVVIIAIVVVLALLALYVYQVVKYNTAKRKHKQDVARRRNASAQIADEREVAPKAVSSRRSAPAMKYYDDGDLDKPDLNYGSSVSTASRQEETQAERDYFEEFFGKK